MEWTSLSSTLSCLIKEYNLGWPKTSKSLTSSSPQYLKPQLSSKSDLQSQKCCPHPQIKLWGFFRGSSKNLNFLVVIQKLSKQEGVGECSPKYLCLYGKCPLSLYSFCLYGIGGRSKRVLKSVYVIYECPLRLYFLRNFEESSKNLKTIDLILTSNFEVFRG